MRAAIIVIALTCSTWQGITTCSSPDGYVSHETTWNGITTGDDNPRRQVDAKRMARAGDHHRHAPAGEVTLMVRIAITQAAFEAIAATSRSAA
jgi:hypothetical protein